MTIGDEVNELVEKYGNGSIGLYILQAALQKACGAPAHASVEIGGKLVSEWNRVFLIRAEEEKIMAKYGSKAKPHPESDRTIFTE